MNSFIEYNFSFADVDPGSIALWVGISCFVLFGIVFSFIVVHHKKSEKKEDNSPKNDVFFSSIMALMACFIVGMLAFGFVGLVSSSTARKDLVIEKLGEAGVTDVVYNGNAETFVGKLDGEVFYGKNIALTDDGKFAVIRVTDETAVALAGM